MRSNNTLLGVSAVLFIALVGVIVYAFGGRPVQDGNPIGYDVTGTPSATAPVATSNPGCLEKKSCKYIAIHFLRLPPGACPSIIQKTELCTSDKPPVRALPQCPSGAECIKFASTQVDQNGEMDATVQDDDGLRSYNGINGEGIIILQSSAPLKKNSPAP